MMKYLLFLGICFGINISGVTQDITGGLKFGYYFQNRFHVSELIDGIAIHSTKSGLDGLKIETFLNYPLSKKIDLSAELGYSWNIGATGPVIQIENATLINDSVYWLTSLNPSFNTMEFNLSGGYRIAQHFQPFIGVGVIRLINFEKSKFTYLSVEDFDSEFQNEAKRINYQNELITSVENSYHNWLLVNSFGLRFSFKHLVTELTYLRTIKPVSDVLLFQGKSYSFGQNMNRLSIMLGYKF